MSKHFTLNIEQMTDTFFEDCSLIAINAPIASYQFCWLINEFLNFKYARNWDADLCLKDKKTEAEICFPVYEMLMNNGNTKDTIYTLRNGTTSLLPELKQFDYLWFIQSANQPQFIDDLLNALKHIPHVSLAREIDPKNLTNLKNLIN